MHRVVPHKIKVEGDVSQLELNVDNTEPVFYEGRVVSALPFMSLCLNGPWDRGKKNGTNDPGRLTFVGEIAQ